MKKLLALALTGAMTLSLAACGGKADTTTADNAAAETTETTDTADAASTDGQSYTVGICQLVQHVALDAATEGFKDALTEEFGDKVTFDEQNAQGDPIPVLPSSTILLRRMLTSSLRTQRRLFRQHRQVPILFRFSEPQLLSTVWPLALTISAELSAEIFPVPQIWLR